MLYVGEVHDGGGQSPTRWSSWGCPTTAVLAVAHLKRHPDFWHYRVVD